MAGQGQQLTYYALETTDDYRRHLYKTTTMKINTTLQTLLHNLYENNLQTISSDAPGSQDEPLRLTIPAKLQREAQKIYVPISAYKIQLTRTNTDGERTSIENTLHTRMQDFEEHLEEEKAEIEKLRKSWDIIVGEIWKVGVQCLGTETMEVLLFTSSNRTMREAETSLARAESTLFVPEHDDSPAPRKKKRVTFEEPHNEDELPTTKDTSLDFLYQPTRLRLKPGDSAPVFPEHDVKTLELRVKELGKKDIAEYRKVETDYHAHWQKKKVQLLDVFRY